MLKKLRKSIFSKILILTTAVSFGLGISVFLVAVREQSQNLENALIEESKLFAQSLAKDIEAGYLLRTLPGQLPKEQILFKGFVFLWVVRPDGEIYFADNPKMIGKSIREPFLGTSTIIVKDSVLSETGQKIKLVVYPLEMGTEKPWNLFMGVSLESIVSAQRKMFFINSVLFAGALIFFILLSFYLTKKVVAPIKKLEEGVKIIGRGNFDHQIKLKTGDEIEDLGHAFNKMTKDLKEYYFALKKEELKTSTVFANFSDGLLVFDKEDNLTLVNPRIKDFFGKEAQNLTGKSIEEIPKIPIFQNLVALYKKSHKEIFRKELKIRESLTLEMTTVPLMIKKERSGTLVILHDVTREKLVEKMKTEFVSLAAHQLRTPLSAIKWIMRMILDEELGKLNEEQKEFLGDGYKSNERMISLVNDLLNVTRIEEGGYIYNLTLTDIEKLTKSVIDSHREKIKKKGIRVEFKKLSEKMPKIMVDAEKIRMAINNIFDNAVRYTLSGGKVTVSLECDKKEIKISIKDSGVGIPEQQQKRVFTKFFRGANIIRMETDGTGLGLYMTKNIVKSHGGKIWFESELGKGTTFYFTIPIKK